MNISYEGMTANEAANLLRATASKHIMWAEIESLQSQIIQLQSRVTIIEEKLLRKGLTE